MSTKQEIEQEIELAEMMAADIDKVYKKYAKAALEAEQKRLEAAKETIYMGCQDKDELQELYGFGDLTEEEYYGGIEYFDSMNTRKKQLSLIEKHRQNLKDIRNRWKGTVKELKEELEELGGVKVQQPMNYIEQLEQQERQERYLAMS